MFDIKKKFFLICLTLVILVYNLLFRYKKNKNNINNKIKYKKYDSYTSESTETTSESCACNKIDKIKPMPNPELRTIALLELSEGSVDFDNNLKKTFEYYFRESPQFKRFPIVDTLGSLDKTIELLDKYYKLGYRIFIGFNRSSILAGVLSWFESHPNTIGISPLSTSPTLSIPKNIYRISPSDTVLVASIELTEFIKTRDHIYYIYSKDQIACLVVLELLLANPDIGDKIIPYPVESDSSNIKVSDLQALYQTSMTPNDINIMYLFVDAQRGTFFNNYSLMTQLPPSPTPIPALLTFDISLQNYPEFNDLEKNVFNNIYYLWTQECLSSSELWRLGKENLPNIFVPSGLNTLQLDNYLKKRIGLKQLSNYGFVQQFDTITKDTKYFTYINYKYTIANWIPDYVIGLDPIVGPIRLSLTS